MDSKSAHTGSVQNGNGVTMRRVGLLLPVVSLMTALTVALVTVAWMAADAQDRLALASMRHTLGSVFSSNHRELGNWASDYVYWDEFVEKAVLDVDPVWIDDNVGTYAHENQHVDITLLVDGGMDVYMISRAEGLDLDARLEPLTTDLETLVRQARDRVGDFDALPEAAMAYVRLSGRVFMAAAATSKWENALSLPERNRGPVVLVYLREIDPEILATFGADYMIDGLMLIDDLSAREDAVPLTAPDGRVIAQVTWMSAHPGTRFLQELILPLAAVLLVAVVLVVVIFVRVRRAVHELVDAHAALNQRSEALRAARDEADRANRAKTEFLAQMSHDLRTPLNAILGFSEVIALQTFGSSAVAADRYRDYARQIHAGGDHLRSLIDSILDVARLDVGLYKLNTETVLLDDVVAASLAMLRDRLEAMAFTVVAPPTALRLKADRGAVEQVLINLVSNAIKYSDVGGRISVTARQVGGMVEVAVIDTGRGMSEEDVESAFELFTRGGEGAGLATEGTGIGLSIVKRLVELHGGTARIASTLGDGTTVTVTLPGDLAATEGEAAAGG